MMPMGYLYNEMEAKKQGITWRDDSFKTENLNLYSAEAEVRAKQVKDVEYDMKLKLSDNLEQGYQGHLEVQFFLS